MDESAIVAAAGLRDRYAEPHRRYHNLVHVEAVLAAVDQLAVAERLADEDRSVVRLAAWFHDAVYDPRASDNEERSAQLAHSALFDSGVDVSVADEVARLVLVTKQHAAAPDDVRAAVLCDADLSVLAGSVEEYARYAAAVREEYAFVGDEDFRIGRAAALRKLLEHEHLFATSYARKHWEPIARNHLHAELTPFS